ncbi:MAG: C40 family peptidase [Candidatus Zixiibacteriota bacterium]
MMMIDACQVQPRYGVEEKERTPNKGYQKNNNQAKIKKGELTTFELLRLGQIIESYLGEPHRRNAQSNGGLDCSKLVVEVFRKFNRTDLPRTAREQFKAGQTVSHRQIKFGDLVFFRTEGNRVSHVGIYIENDEFAHASLSSGVIISSLNDSYWEKRLVGCRRVLNQ